MMSGMSADVRAPSPWDAPAAADYGVNASELHALLTRVTPDNDNDQPEEAQAFGAQALEQCAGFGEPPDTLLRAIPYALRVLARKRALRERLSSMEAQEQHAWAAAQGALEQAGEGFYRRAPQALRQPLSNLFDRVAQAEEMAADREDVQMLMAEQEQTERGEHEAAIEAARKVAAPFQRRLQAAQRMAAEERTAMERAAAMLKRTEIAMRAGRKAGQMQQLAQLEQEHAERQADLEARRAALAKANQAEAAAQAELDAQLSSVREAEQKRDSARAQSDKQAQRYADEVKEAGAARSSALAELARHGLRRRLLPAELAAPCLDALRQLQAAASRTALHQAAAQSFDTDGVRNGLLVLCGTAMALAVTLWALL